MAWLFAVVAPRTTTQLTSLLVYGAGLIGMLTASATYHLARPGWSKAMLRRLDHAMIFVMIAGSYTPLALDALEPWLGKMLCCVEWGLAAVGITLKLALPGRSGERMSLALYLGMGWLLILVIRPLVAALPGEVLTLLLAGGIVYTLGSFVHARGDRMPFQNAIWHVMVLIAAGLHLAAMARLFAPATD